MESAVAADESGMTAAKASVEGGRKGEETRLKRITLKNRNDTTQSEHGWKSKLLQ